MLWITLIVSLVYLWLMTNWRYWRRLQRFGSLPRNGRINTPSNDVERMGKPLLDSGTEDRIKESFAKPHFHHCATAIYRPILTKLHITLCVLNDLAALQKWTLLFFFLCNKKLVLSTAAPTFTVTNRLRGPVYICTKINQKSVQRKRESITNTLTLAIITL